MLSSELIVDIVNALLLYIETLLIIHILAESSIIENKI